MNRTNEILLTQEQLAGGLTILLGRQGWTMRRVSAQLTACYRSVVNWKHGHYQISPVYQLPLQLLLVEELGEELLGNE